MTLRLGESKSLERLAPSEAFAYLRTAYREHTQNPKLGGTLPKARF